MGLKVIVVGAGIAGLTAAISLRQAGHSVQIFEKSKFATEIGAALGLSPNGTRVLQLLGFSFERARAMAVQTWDIVDAVSLKVLNSMDLSDSTDRFGFGSFTVHRVDLHSELLRLAQDSERDNAEVVQLHLSSRVVDGNSSEGWILLEDGSKHYADLIVGADGVRSVIRPLVIESQGVEPTPTGFSAFRFLLPTQLLHDDPKLIDLLRWKGLRSTALVNPKDPVPERHMAWYACQGGEVQNFVGIHATRLIPEKEDGTPDFKSAVIDEFQAYHPDLKRVLALADNVSCWSLDVHNPLSRWFNGKMVVIGDAAHPMLPFGGQGANQAIEDAGALGCVLTNCKTHEEVSARLRIFEDVRIKRASLIQTLSKVRIGKEKDVEHELWQYAEPGSRVPGSFAERNAHAYSYDVIAASNNALKATT